MKTLPPAPPGWNKTISDLFQEMKAGVRDSLGSPEVDWALNYEKSLLPPGTRFPKEGEVYEALEDVELNYLTSWTAPFTGGGAGVLPKGQWLRVAAILDPQPISAYADAVNYKTMEELIVPVEDRTAQNYSAFYFSVPTALFNTKFRRINDGQT